ncbi:iron complex outermembrane receptor protein [Mucilaginibacter frigoritolerans]|uniref:Iron complex outermembrane receptor protein n=1 Tax=Mucilaginibacter frigoritolerans TaxID=652788 RepID=A0A562UHG2_9SPHI|nr:TonB-dependent receptor [Mucilaginibacter frigoritolerans]TWJ04521.1 iron complex outermembrane receptor protein [Mucilaginibacter frigoritolerans]
MFKFSLSIKNSSAGLLTLFLLISGFSYGQQKGTVKGIIQGNVVTTQKEAAENISVKLKGTSYGVVTDKNGEFEFKAPAGNYKLVVSHVGIKNQEIDVVVKGGETTVVPVITVQITASALKEVTINGNKTNKFVKKHTDDVQKIPLDNLENPQVYSNITSALLEEQNVTTVDNAIKNVPGIQTMWQATGRSGDGGAYYTSRGFAVQSLLRDGVLGNVSNTIDLINVESVEVLKGPSATLFGSALTSYGGLINRVTKKPYDTLGGQITYNVGSYGFNRVSADVNTPLDSAKKLLFRLNTAFNYQGSWQQNGFSRGTTVDPSLLYKVNDRLSIQFDAELFEGNNTIQPIYFFSYGATTDQLGATNAKQLNLDYYKTYNNGDLSQQSKSYNFFGVINYKISDHWKSQTNFSSAYSYSNGFGPYYYLMSKDSMARDDQSTRNSWQKQLDVQENINGDFNIGKLRNRFVGGLDFYRVNSDQSFIEGSYDVVPINSSTFNYTGFNKANLSAQYATGGYYVYPYIFSSNTYAAYASDVLNITDKLIAQAAIRFDHFDNQGSYNPTTQVKSGMYTQNAWSPKFGLIYQLVKNEVSLFANYQNGFTNENGLDYTGKTFRPEEANQIEGGVKISLFDGKLTSTLSYYDIKVQDIIRPYNATLNIQDGTQLSKGFEAEVIANPFTGFNVVAGFAYNDSKYTDISPDINGTRPTTAGSPYTANLWLSYRLPKELIKGLGIGIGGNYASANDVLNTSTGVFTLPSYVVLNTSAFYEYSKYRFSFGVNNFTNEKYWTGYSTLNPQMPRQVVGSVAFKF